MVDDTEVDDVAKRYRYKSYRGRKRDRRNMIMFVVSVMAVIFGMTYLIRHRGGQAVRDVTGEEISYGDLANGRQDDTEGPFDEPARPAPVSNRKSEVEQPLPGPTIAPATMDIKPEEQPKKQTTLQSVESTSDEARQLITHAQQAEIAGDFISARDKLNASLQLHLGERVRELVKIKLGNLSAGWLFGKKVLPGDTLTTYYTVRPGDTLAKIAGRNDIPYEFLMRINGIKNPRLLPSGRQIKIVKGPFHAKVSRSNFTLDLYIGDKMFVKSYKVGLGEVGRDTPTGTWRVRTNGKAIKPVWPNPVTHKLVHADEPDYPLGTRWIGIVGIDGEAKGRVGFGIHGTKDHDSIGKRTSQGCIRLYNGQVQELYDTMTPGLSEIHIVD